MPVKTTSPASTIALTPSRAAEQLWKQFPYPPHSLGDVNQPWQPAVELSETAAHIYVQVQLPGFTREEIDVQATPTDVVVRGAHFSSAALPQRCVLASEFHYGSFERRIRFPVPVTPQSTIAELHNGLLTLTLFKAAACEQRTPCWEAQPTEIQEPVLALS